ncbi:MAG: VOC family protein, partial [Boseongicola sp.]|nr:VOC family protein [Boseongicola sp.]
MTERGFRVRGLGEIAIRCDDLERMTAFYGDVLGLERMEGNAAEGIVFFRIVDGFGGHTQVLALFDKQYVSRPGLHQTGIEAPATGASSSLHHLALSLPYGEQEAVMGWYEAQGLPYRVETFEWVGWRGVFTEDPEGNTVELVAYDGSIKADLSREEDRHNLITAT